MVQVLGAETTLSLPRGLPAAARPLPAEAEMSFEHDRQIVMLSGMLMGGDDVSARFRIDDGIAPRELRKFSRLSVGLPIAVTQLTDAGGEAGPAEEMRTVDISAGGVLLDRQGMSGAVRVELELPGGFGTVTAVGRVVRNIASGSGVSFEGLDPDTRNLLDNFVLAVRHQLAQRFAQAGGLLADYPWLMLDENKWLAARHGLDGELVDLPSNERVATKALARRLLDRLREHAQDMGSADDLEGIVDLLERGSGGQRQMVVYEANHDLDEVMAEIVAATAA